MNTSKKNILQEWISHFKERKDWKGIIEVASTSWVYVNPISMHVLKYIYKIIQKESETYFESLDIFEKKSKIKLTLKEWRNANSEINKACIFYVKLILLEKNTIASELDLQQYFLEAGMWKNLLAQRNRNKKALDDYEVNDASYGYHLATFHELDLLDIRNQDNRKKLLSLDDFEQGIELHYHENKLRILCEKAARFSYKNTANLSESERNWFNRIPEEIKKYPQIELFILSYKMILEQSDNTFNIIEEKLSNVIKTGKISKAYLQNFYVYLLLHSIYKINQEKYIYAEKYFNISNQMLKDDYGKENDYLPAWRFKNIIKSAAKMLLIKNRDESEIFQKIDRFILEHSDKMIPSSQASIIGYCNAYISYLRKDFQKAELILSRLETPKDELNQIDFLFLYLFILLENEETDHFLRIRDNLRQMLYLKDKIATNYIQKMKITILYLSKVQKKPVENTNTFYANCLIEIKEDENFFKKDWLIQFLERKIGA